jgi:mono/diheme cytochrome c family protein
MKLLLAVAVVAVVMTAGLFMLPPDFFSARKQPARLEAYSVRWLRHLAIPRQIRALHNPVALSPEALTDGREHFADHCAICHGNDGRGRTDMGPNFYPPVPDMTAAETQSLSDGEIFYAIKNGIRFTGMPAWGSDNTEDDQATWKLVHLVRHLPKITGKELQEMRKMNPKSPQEMEEEHQDDKFLDGGDPTESHGHSH